MPVDITFFSGFLKTLSQYSKVTHRYKLSSKQEDERTKNVYNYLCEQTEHEDDTY